MKWDQLKQLILFLLIEFKITYILLYRLVLSPNRLGKYLF